jgi:hypothetical protein
MATEFKRPSIIDGKAQIYKSISEPKNLGNIPVSLIVTSAFMYLSLYLLFWKWWVIAGFIIQLMFLFIVGRKDPFLLKTVVNNLFKKNVITK